MAKPRTRTSQSSAEPIRSGRAAIVGRPNAGKSTLLNALVGTKLAIATSKPGTTRNTLLAVAVVDDPPTQIAFVDTPGLHRPKSALGNILVEEARQGLADVDVVVFVATSPSDADLKGGVERLQIPSGPDAEILALARESGKPVILALNKIDRLKDKRLVLPVLQRWQSAFEFAALIPLSALRGKQLGGLVAEVRKHLPEGALFADDFLTDRSERFLVAELIREAAIRQTHAEVPHGIAVHIDQFVDADGRSRIAATLLVEKDSHKGIVLGRGGTKIRDIGTDARRGIEELLGRPVYLELWVSVSEGWTADPERAKRHVREVEGS